MYVIQWSRRLWLCAPPRGLLQPKWKEVTTFQKLSNRGRSFLLPYITLGGPDETDCITFETCHSCDVIKDTCELHISTICCLENQNVLLSSWGTLVAFVRVFINGKLALVTFSFSSHQLLWKQLASHDIIGVSYYLLREKMKRFQLTNKVRMTAMQGQTPERVITPIKMAALQVSQLISNYLARFENK